MADHRSNVGRFAPGYLAIGSGWPIPAALVFGFLAMVYLPAHSPGSLARSVLAAVGAMYVIGVSVIVPRLLGILVLRHAGSRHPIVLLGRTPDPQDPPDVPPRTRLAAVSAGIVASASIVTTAAWLVARTSPSTDAHAIGTVAVAASAVVTLGSILPAPRFGGWSALCAIATLRGVQPAWRVAWVAARARRAALLLALVVGGVAIAVDVPLLIPMGVALAAYAWTKAGTAREVDAAAQFFTRHTAAAVSGPLTAVHGAGDRLTALAPAARVAPALVIDDEGALLGAMGPRQVRRALKVTGPNARCADAMIHVGSLVTIPGGAPAAVLVEALARDGFVLVSHDAGFLVADAADIGPRVVSWALAANWSAPVGEA